MAEENKDCTLHPDPYVSFEECQKMTFEECCERVRKTPITADMTYEERLAMLRKRYGLWT